MAFATSNVARISLGSTSGMVGTWTGTNGDASGTVTGTGYCLVARFLPNTSTSPSNPIQPRISNSSGTWTVTVPYQETVTAGTFQIEFK